jgi:putative thiamine transport system ATP-binding protein
MTADGTLLLKDVTLRLGDKTLIDGLSLAVPPGKIVTVMGPSGSGKSTLLSWICGSAIPAFAIDGGLKLDGLDISHLPLEARRVGILFQDPRGVSPGERAKRVAEALAEAEMPGFEDRDPATLSGGQRARIALMRTLLAEPKALLLDEPFSRLDAALRDRIRRFTFDHAMERGLPTLLVTHDPDDAAAAGGPIIEIDIAPC